MDTLNKINQMLEKTNKLKQILQAMQGQKYKVHKRLKNYHFNLFS